MSRIACALLVLLAHAFAQTDRSCGSDIRNLWLDVILLVDNSQEVKKYELIKVAADMVSTFNSVERIGTKNYQDDWTTRVGIITYDSNATSIVDLDQYQSSGQLCNGFFDQLSSVTTTPTSNMKNGLIAAESVFRNGRKDNRRSNVKQFLLIYAATYSTGEDDPRPAAQRLLQSGIIISTVQLTQTPLSEVPNFGDISSPNLNFTNDDHDIVRKLQSALLETNCFCPSGWTMYKGECLKVGDITATWRAAQLGCQNFHGGAHLHTEFDEDKHDFAWNLIQNSLPKATSYHLGLSLINGRYMWEHGNQNQIAQTGNGLWNPGYPVSNLTANVANYQTSDGKSIGWQNIPSITESHYYICEMPTCDTSNYCEN